MSPIPVSPEGTSVESNDTRCWGTPIPVCVAAVQPPRLWRPWGSPLTATPDISSPRVASPRPHGASPATPIASPERLPETCHIISGYKSVLHGPWRRTERRRVIRR